MWRASRSAISRAAARYDRCTDLIIQGIKLFSFKMNGDGIDPNGCQRVTVENCLVSTGDDAVVIKATETHPDVSDITVRGCVLETYPKTTAKEGGDPVKIGTETFCQEMSGIRVQDCDIVRAFGGMAFSIMHRDKVRIHDVHFENIRIEDRVEKENFGIKMLDSKPGTVSDVTLKAVSWAGDNDIVLQGKGISGVKFHQCTVAGKPLKQVKVSGGAAQPEIVP